MYAPPPDLVQQAFILISQFWRQIGVEEVRWGLYWVSSYLAAKGSLWAEQELRKWVDRNASRRYIG